MADKPRRLCPVLMAAKMPLKMLHDDAADCRQDRCAWWDGDSEGGECVVFNALYEVSQWLEEKRRE